MSDYWYNTKEGIAHQVQNLYTLNELFEARRKAGSSGNLNEFVLLGKWRLDRFGNATKAVAELVGDIIPGIKYPDIPKVLTDNELAEFLRGKGEANPQAHYTSNSELPPTQHICPHCQQEWTLDNCWDCTTDYSGSAEVRAEDVNFVGRQLWELKRFFEVNRNDAVFFMHPDSMVRNSRFIDQRPHPRISDIARNRQGIVGSHDGLGDWYVIQPNDVMLFQVRKHFHSACYKKHVSELEKAKMLECFKEALLPSLSVEEIPNEYCGCVRCPSWLLVETKLGTFKVGWRKRVIVLDWKRTDKKFAHLFKDEDATQDEHSIHCWGYDKLKEYLRRIYFSQIPIATPSVPVL